MTRGWWFGLVGLLGLVVNQAVLGLLVSGFGVNYLIGAAVASQASTASTFAINELWVFRGQAVSRRAGAVLRRLAIFDALNVGSLLLRLPVLFVLTSVAHVNYLISNLAAIGVFMLARFVVAEGWIWRPAAAVAVAPAPEHG